MITIPDFSGDGKDPRTLVVNIGNTNTRFGWFQGRALSHTEAFSTPLVQAHPPDLPAAEALAIVSVVPAASAAVLAAWATHGARLLTAESSGLPIAYEPPGAMGADRLANAIALLERGHAPGIAIDCGTATTLTVVDSRGVVVGGVIAPGLGTSARALIGNTAQLPEVPLLRSDAPWGTDTITCLQLGMVEGHIGLIRHLVARIRAGLGTQAPAILCGGWSGTLAPGLPDYACAPYLTLEGARAFASRG